MSLPKYLCSAAAIALLPAFAHAQGFGQTDASLDAIIVTAQKREQNLQDVPVAVTAISGETLTNRNDSSVSDLPRLAPSLTLTQGNLPTNNSLNLRGIGTIAFGLVTVLRRSLERSGRVGLHRVRQRISGSSAGCCFELSIWAIMQGGRSPTGVTAHIGC